MHETHAFDASVTPRVTSHALFLEDLTHGFWSILITCANFLLSRDLLLTILVDFTLRAKIIVIFVLIIVLCNKFCS